MIDAGGIKATLTVEGLRKFQSDMGSAGDSMDAAGRKGQAAGSKIAAGARVGFLAAGAAAVVAVKQYASFDDAMNRVKINSGATSKQMDALGRTARDMGKKFPASATEAAEAMNELLKAGMSVEDVLGGGLEQAMAMATAEGIDMAASATAMAQAMAVFSVEGRNANTVTAALSNVASGTSANMSDLTQSLAQVGGTAMQAGMSVGETTSALGVLIQNGLDGSKAGTALNSMLLSLRAPTDSAAKALKKAGVEVYDATGRMKPFRDVIGSVQQALARMSSDQERAAFLQKAFGVDGQQAASILSKQAPLYDQLARSVQNIDAPVQKARDQMSSLKMQLDTTGESIGTAAVQIGGALAPAVAAALGPIRSVADAIGAAPDSVIQYAAGWALLTAGLFAAAPVITATVTALRGLSGAIAVQAALSGATGAIGMFMGATGAATIGIRALTAAMLANPLFLGATVATGIVGAVFALNSFAGAGTSASAELNAVSGAASSSASAATSAAVALRNLKASQDEMSGASVGLQRAQLTLEQAIVARDAALQSSGRTSLEYRSAALAVREAEMRVADAKKLRTERMRQAKADELSAIRNAQALAAQMTVMRSQYTSATSALSKFSDITLRQSDGSRKSVSEIAKTRDGLEQLATRTDLAGTKIQDLARQAVKADDGMQDAARSAPGLASGIEKIGSQSSEASLAVSSLRSELNSLPDEVTTTVRVKREGKASGGAVGVSGYATGGRVYGPGTGRSDSVPAMLSAGEWVLTAKQAQAIGYGNLAALPRFAQGGAWFTSQASAAQASIGTGSASWKSLEQARNTSDLADDLAVLEQQRANIAERLGRIRNESASGSGDTLKANNSARSSAIQSVLGTLNQLDADIWRMRNIEMPNAAAAAQQESDAARAAAAQQDASARAAAASAAASELERQQAAARSAAVAGVGAKGSDLWKQASLAGATETLDDDRAALTSRLSALQALGTPEAAQAITDTLADIWTLDNITAPAQAAQQAQAEQARVDQRAQWERDAAMAMSRGFYAGGGGAGGGGNMGITESTGGTTSGVGHHPRPEVDRIWLAGQQLNDLDAREGVGVEITDILGWDEAEDFESVRSKRADGDALGGTRDGSVQVVVRGRLRGSTYADYHARRRALKALVRAAADEVLLKVPDVTHGDSAGDYTDTYAESGMEGYERRSVRLVSNLKWGDEFGQFGSAFEFTLRSPQRFVVSDVAAEAPSSDNAAALSTAGDAALTSVLAIRGEIAASPALDTSREFMGVDQSARIAVRAGSSDEALDTFTKLADPAALAGGSADGASWDPSGTYLALAGSVSPYITIYKRSGDTFTKLAAPSDLPAGAATDASFDPTGTYLSVSHATSPRITIYKRSGDTFTKLADPTGGTPSATALSTCFDPTSTYLYLGFESPSPYIYVYKRSGDAFARIAGPASLPPGAANGGAFDPSGTYLAVAHSTTPYITIYKRSGDTFTRLADPSSLPGGTSYGAAFDPSGTYLAVAHTSTPYITIYKRSGDTFTKLSNPAELPASNANSASFDPSGTYLAVAHSTTPYITIYKRSGDTFTKLDNPASLPSSTPLAVAFDPSGAYLSAGAPDATPLIYSVSGAGSALEAALGTLTISPATVAIAGAGASLPVASADFLASGNLTARDAFLIDTLNQTATPMLRTPLARLIGGGTMLHAMLPTRSSKNDYTLNNVIAASPRVADAISAIGALATSGNVVNEAASGWNNYPGTMPLATTDDTVTTALAGWRCKVSGSDFTQNGYALRRLDARLGEPTARPVMHVALIAPPATWATTQTALAAASGIDFAAYLSIQSTHSTVVRNTSVGLYHDGTRMVPGVLHARTATARIARFSGAPAITPDAAAHVFAAVIIDAGEIHHSAIALLDVNTGEPISWISHSMSVFGTASTEQTDASQAVTASGSPTLTDAFVAGSDRSVGIGGTAATIQLTGLATSAAGHSGIVTLDALEELAPYGVTLAGASSGLQSRTALANIARVLREWIGDRFAPQTIIGQPLALGVEWSEREPSPHGEPYVRLDSIIATDVEQALGKSRTGGLSTEHMSVAGSRGVGGTPIEARSVR